MKSRDADRVTLLVLFAIMIVVTAASIRFGAIDFSVRDMLDAVSGTLAGRTNLPLDQRIFMQLRVPRAILCLLVGACLGVGGTLMQALFRNPIVEPGLVGTSSGAAFGAALFYVFGALLKVDLGAWTLPLAACGGGVLSTYLVFALAQTKHGARSSIMLLLLTGLAINALFMTINVVMVAVATAFTGVISFVGLIVPHILRIIRGPGNRFLIIGSALLGGTLLSVADLIARVSLRPAELPIGIVTSVVGVPLFLSLLRRREYLF
jgi:ABC-type Fe3+-siderophore transport system permease subunit